MEERYTVVEGPQRSLDCFVVLPDTAKGRSPAVVVIHEIFGADPHVRDVARRFAREGFVAAAPNLFTGPYHRLLSPENVRLAMQALAQAPPDLRKDPGRFAEFAASRPPEERPVLEAFGQVTSAPVQQGFALDLVAVTRYLRGLPQVDPARVGAVGFCFGGTMAGLLATVDPELRTAVIFYGHAPPTDAIPRIRAKVLGLYGSEDGGITTGVPDLAREMAAAGKSFEYRIYEGARHAFFNDTRPTYYHASSAIDAWPRVLAFLRA